MFSQVFVSGMVTNIYEPNTDGVTYMTVKMLKTINSNNGPKTTWAEILLKNREGYEKYTGKISVGDLVNCLGRFEVTEKGSPVFSKEDGLPKFVLNVTMLKDLGAAPKQTGNDMFFVMILGNLGRDPEMRYLESGAGVTDFSMASSYTTKVKGANVKETTWWRVSAWNKRAETAAQWLKKGMKVLVEADIQYDEETHGPKTFTDKVTKELRSGFEVNCNNFTMIGSAGGGSAPREQGYIPDEEEEEGEAPKEETPSEEPKTKIPF